MLGAFGCRSESDGATGQTQRAALPLTGAVQVSWGEQPTTLRLQRPGYEQVATGPSAIAVSGGTTLVLDRLAGRIVAVGADGTLDPVTTVAPDAEELVAGPNGSFAAWSPTRARVWVYAAGGHLQGEVAVPRSLREVVSIELGASFVVEAVTAYQERFTLGSPQAPMTLGATLRTKREGAVALPSGEGVQARVDDGKAALWVVQPGKERTEVVAQHPIAAGVTAARIVGHTGTVVCARVETVTSAPEIEVKRHLSCVDVSDGTVVVDEALPAVGAYLPRRELAVGANGVAFMHPTPAGLTVQHMAFEEGSR